MGGGGGGGGGGREGNKTLIAHRSLDQKADVVVADGAAVERGTLFDLLHHLEVKAGSYGRQSLGKASCVGEWNLGGRGRGLG